MKKSVFTISLDCEGLWGMADNAALINSAVINESTLRNAYDFLLKTLSDVDLKATAAFVTAFASDWDAVRENRSLLEKMAGINPEWFINVLPVIQRCSTGGAWTGADFYQLMFKAGHEMAWHGASHLPLNEKTSPEAVELELELASRLFQNLDQVPKTIIFPRNQIGHLNKLRTLGFTAYRASPKAGIVRRLSGLANEWNVFDGGTIENPMIESGWQVSPAGCFLNWPSGIRRLIPVSVTIKRWKSLLRHAAERGRFVHMWFHPHNLITAPNMRYAFKEIVSYAGELVRSGDLLNLTIAEANKYYITEMNK
jgi:hypothetical protein